MNFTKYGLLYRAACEFGSNDDDLSSKVKYMRQVYGYPTMETKMAVCNAIGDVDKALAALKLAFNR